MNLSIAPKFDANAVPDIKYIKENISTYFNLTKGQSKHGSWSLDNLEMIVGFIRPDSNQNDIKAQIENTKSQKKKKILLTFLALTILRVKFEIKDEWK